MMHITIANPITLLIASAVAFIAGGIWYGPIFGKAWWTAQPHRKSKKSKPSPLGLVVQALHLIIVGVVVFKLAEYTTAETAFLLLALMTSLGMISGGIFMGQSRKLVLINIGQYLLTLAIFAIATTL